MAGMMMGNLLKKLVGIAVLASASLFVAAPSVVANEPVIKVPPDGTKLVWACSIYPKSRTWTIKRDQSENIVVVIEGVGWRNNRNIVYHKGLFLPGIVREIYYSMHDRPSRRFASKYHAEYGEPELAKLRSLTISPVLKKIEFNILTGQHIGSNFTYRWFQIDPNRKMFIQRFGEELTVIPLVSKSSSSKIVWYYSPKVSLPVRYEGSSGQNQRDICTLIDVEYAVLNVTKKYPLDENPLVKTSVQHRRPSNVDMKHFVENSKRYRDAVGIIIGNKKYKGHTPEVSFAHNDANAFKDYLLNWLGYREGNIIDLRDATQAELMAVFGNHSSHEGKLFNYVRAGKSDVTVFYSGHGVPGMNDRRGYLLPADADPDLIEINGYPIETLFKNLAQIPAKSMSVFLDACFSGDSPKGMIIRATSGLSVTPKLPTNVGRMVVLTAAQGDQFASWDEEAKQGLFTKHLLAALKGAADQDGFGNGDGQISLAEVQKYLDDEMTYQARRRFGRKQQAYALGDPTTIMATH